jgi:hypothetical protein
MRNYIARFIVFNLCVSLLVNSLGADAYAQNFAPFPTRASPSCFTEQALINSDVWVRLRGALQPRHWAQSFLRMRGTIARVEAPRSPSSSGQNPRFLKFAAVLALTLAASYWLLPVLAGGLHALAIAKGTPLLLSSFFRLSSWALAEWTAKVIVPLLSLSVGGTMGSRLLHVHPLDSWEEWSQRLKASPDDAGPLERSARSLIAFVMQLANGIGPWELSCFRSRRLPRFSGNV